MADNMSWRRPPGRPPTVGDCWQRGPDRWQRRRTEQPRVRWRSISMPCGASRRTFVMNKYGLLAKQTWQQVNPKAYGEIPNREEFFSTLGAEAEQRVSELEIVLAGPDLPDEGYLGKVGRLNNARMQAEEVATQELLHPPLPEPGAGDRTELETLLAELPGPASLTGRIIDLRYQEKDDGYLDWWDEESLRLCRELQPLVEPFWQDEQTAIEAMDEAQIRQATDRIRPYWNPDEHRMNKPDEMG